MSKNAARMSRAAWMSFDRTSIAGILALADVASHFRPRLKEFGGAPVALDVGEDRPDFIVRQFRAERRHIAFIPGGRMRRHQPARGDAEEHIVRLVPGVPALIVRRCGHVAVRQTALPSRLALEPGAMARSAMLDV